MSTGTVYLVVNGTPYSGWHEVTVQRAVDNAAGSFTLQVSEAWATGAGPTAVIEMWGNHIGFMYADRTYCIHHSLVTNSDPVIINRHRHLNALERFDPKAALGSPNANDPEDAWIPAGLLLDCMDDNALNPTAVADPVVDMVKDFSMATCFQAVVAGRACIPCVKTFMLQHLPPGQSAADLELLFSEYGF